MTGLESVRLRVQDLALSHIHGADRQDTYDAVHDAPGERWFPEDAAIRHVFADAAGLVGGMRSLLIQTLHPLAMAGVDQHSDYRSDPWGRLQRTGAFLAMTVFGPAEDAERAVARVRGIHQRINGIADDGTPYRASDPHLLSWVHVTEVDSFMTAHRLYGAKPLDQAGYDEYVAQSAFVARKLGVLDPPETVAEVAEQLAAFRPELRSTPAARATTRFLVLTPPVPLVARAPYAVLSAAAVASLPRWTRWPLRLPYLPITERTAARIGGKAFVGTFRWLVAPPADSVAASATDGSALSRG